MSRISGLRNDTSKRTFYKERKLTIDVLISWVKKYNSFTDPGHKWGTFMSSQRSNINLYDNAYFFCIFSDFSFLYSKKLLLYIIVILIKQRVSTYLKGIIFSENGNYWSDKI